MENHTSPGLIWFYEIFHSGNQDDFEAFCSMHEDVKLVMSYYATSPRELQNIANNLNNSNILATAKL